MLSHRQLDILKLIIRLYAIQQEPVGSKTLLKEAELPFSSATIRNEMMKLEELGFLEKTHSSSGRVPSVLGYKFYVEQMLPTIQKVGVEPDELKIIRDTLKQKYYEIDEMITISAKMLSHLTNYTSVVLGPEMRKSKLTGFRLVPLNRTQVMVILVTDKGAVENRTFNIPEDLSHEELEKMVDAINSQLIGLDLSEVFLKLQQDIPMMMKQSITQKFDILPILQGLITRLEEERISVAGKSNLFDYVNYDENKDVLKHIYKTIDNAHDLYALTNPNHKGIDIKFGQDLPNQSFKDLSVVTKTYHTTNGEGVIALIGPKNMSYDRVVGLMNAMSDELTDSINQYLDDL